MVVYRIAKEKYIRDLAGTGARLSGGRWNNKGVGILYASESRAL
ncbi:MAG: RES family NAD+ phosphorylase, partial [Deltaproteobacteria bacterium]|nr:RES family NAD+ phosphorylase [Deltaproteobacteria bacterium]